MEVYEVSVINEDFKRVKPNDYTRNLNDKGEPSKGILPDDDESDTHVHIITKMQQHRRRHMANHTQLVIVAAQYFASKVHYADAHLVDSGSAPQL